MLKKISNKRLAKGEKLAWNSTIKAKAYTLKKSPLRKVSKKSASLWSKARKECLERYGNRCFLCGAENCEIHIHHWQETRSQNPARKYDITNCVPLCSKCHNHNGVDARFYELREMIAKKKCCVESSVSKKIFEEANWNIVATVDLNKVKTTKITIKEC